MEKLTLRQYIANLVEISEENPHLLDMPIITFGDYEGNYFNFVYFYPTPMIADDLTGSRIADVYETESEKANCVCIN